MELVYHRDKWELHGTMTVLQALKEVGLDGYDLLVIRKGKILKEDDVLHEDDRVDCIDFVAGG
jgi:sulfur carrier protein ThiS